MLESGTVVVGGAGRSGSMGVQRAAQLLRPAHRRVIVSCTSLQAALCGVGQILEVIPFSSKRGEVQRRQNKAVAMSEQLYSVNRVYDSRPCDSCGEFASPGSVMLLERNGF